MFKRSSSKKNTPSLFWRYLTILATLLCLLLLVSLLITRLSTKALRESYLAQAEIHFRDDGSSFRSMLDSLRLLPDAVKKNLNAQGESPYVKLSRLKTEDSARAVSYLNDLYNSLSRLGFSYQASRFCFIYFPESGFGVSDSAIFMEPHMGIDRYYVQAEGKLSDQLVLEKKDSLNRFRLLSVPGLSIADFPQQDYLLLLLEVPANGCLFGSFYTRDSVESQFSFGNYPEGSTLRLYREEREFFRSGEDVSADSHEYTVEIIPDVHVRASLTIPNSYFSQEARHTNQQILRILVLTAFFGSILCLLLSYFSVSPLRKLISRHELNESGGSSSELSVIENYIRTSSEKNRSLEERLLSSLISCTMAGIPLRNEAELDLLLPLFEEPMRLALIHQRLPLSEENTEEPLLPTLLAALPESFVCNYISLQEVCVLFPARDSCCQELEENLRQLNMDLALESAGASLICGISRPILDPTELSAAMREAQMTLPVGDSSFVLYAKDGPDGGISPETEGFNLAAFERALEGWNMHGITLELDRYLEQLSLSPEVHPEEYFSCLLFLIRNFAAVNRLDFSAYQKIRYVGTASPAANFRSLQDIVGGLFDQRALLQVSDQEILQDKIVQYINENFTDVNLCTRQIADYFNTSEQFIYNSVSAQTGCGITAYLHRLRVELAARLLTTQEDSTMEIAAKCGFSSKSTFYRSFKQQYHMAPADYRSKYKNTAERADTTEERASENG